MPLYEVHFTQTTRSTQYGVVIVEAPNATAARKSYILSADEAEMYETDSMSTFTVDSVRLDTPPE